MFSLGLIDENDIYSWEVLIIGPPDTLYESEFLKPHLHFLSLLPYTDKIDDKNMVPKH